MHGLEAEESGKAAAVRFIKEEFGTEPDFPWSKPPGGAVFRHARSGKWFALLMQVDRQKLGLEADGVADILNLKCEPDLLGSLVDGRAYFPAYHMNKSHWITVLLDGSAPAERIRDLIRMSYELT